MTKFDVWLNSAKPGEKFVYHQRKGPLMNCSLIYAVRIAHDRGLIDLAQKRVEPPKDATCRGNDGIGRFEYIAIKRREVEARVPSEWQTRPISQGAA